MGIRDLNASSSETTALLQRFDAEMRGDPPRETGVCYEHDAGIVRARGANNWILWWTFGAASAAAAVDREAAYFRRMKTTLEWKVYGHDGPANLVGVLGENGFAADESETLMLRDLTASDDEPVRLPAGVEIRPVSDEQGLIDLVSVTTQAFGADHGWIRAALTPRLFESDPATFAYVVYSGEPVAAGRLELARERSFASLWGGATIPASRRRGLFTALVTQRCNAARRAGYRYITVDARESSRPILESLGFRSLTTITGWILAGETPAPAAESETT